MRRFAVIAMIAAFCVGMGVNAYGAEKAPVKKEMTPSAVAGTYVRTVSGQPGTLTVKAAGKDKIDVKIEASMEGARKGKGTTSGIIGLKNGFASLVKKSKKEFSVSIRFEDGIAILMYDGDGFGEAGVDPAGVYRKKK